jgi:2-polyprenyl-3-methyl-5-hydroxy-6-metoxy-1,4-benzoquinol methylase
MKITSEILRDTYKISYFQGDEYLHYLRDKEIIQLNFGKRMNWIKIQAQHGAPISHCLEIGCAYGFFGEVLLKHFPVKYCGIDVVPEAVNFGRDQLGLDLKTGDYLELEAPIAPYSDVFLWDVIEHLPNPEQFIQKVYQELLPGGRIFISTGDIGALLPRIQGPKWRMIHPPSHLQYFSSATLEALLHKYGYTVISTRYFPVYRSIRQIFYSLFMLNKRGKSLKKVLDKIPENWTFFVNTYDIVFLTATKESL